MLGLEASLMCTESPQACIAKSGPEPANKKRLEFLIRAEDDYIPTTSFLKNVQTSVDKEMRARVVEQMSEAIQDSSSDVFQTSCNLLDRFLSKRVITSEQDLTACAGACVMIAYKVRNRLDNEQQHQLTASIPCTMDYLVSKEKEICHCLRWNLYCVTPSDFIYELLPLMKLPHKYMNMVRQHASTLSSFAVSEYNLVGQPSSLVACGAICCAVDSLQPELTQECLRTLTYLTGIEQEPLLQCQRNINGCFEQRLYELEQYHVVLHKEEEPDACTPTEIGDLFFQNIQKPHLPVHGGREHF